MCWNGARRAWQGQTGLGSVRQDQARPYGAGQGQAGQRQAEETRAASGRAGRVQIGRRQTG